MCVRNYPGTNVNIVGKDMPIARIYADILPLMLATSDKLYVESWTTRVNQYILFITLFDHFKIDVVYTCTQFRA